MRGRLPELYSTARGALDVNGTKAIEELMFALESPLHRRDPPHNLAQTRRASDKCIFMLLGELIEHCPITDLFLSPKNPRTAEYIEGRYG